MQENNPTMALNPGLCILDDSTEHWEQIVKNIVYIQASCIINDHTMATFIPPLSYDRMLDRWNQFVAESSEGKRLIVVWLIKTSDRSRESPDADFKMPFDDTEWPHIKQDLEVGGVISLSLPKSETGPFRALVQNLFVHPLHRRKGIATTLLRKIESSASEAGRWSLMLDTTVGTPAEKIYEAQGWNRLGVVNDYGLRPTGHGDEMELADEVWFWKDLRSQKSSYS